MNQNRYALRALAFAFACFLLNGCAANSQYSLLSPNVGPDGGATPPKHSDLVPKVGAPNIQPAIDYADSYIRAYQLAEREHGSFNIIAGSALIGLGTFAGVKAITGANGDQIASLAGGTLGGYGLASFIGSSKYAAAYNNGRLALSCATQAATGAIISDDDYDALVNADLNSRLGTLRSVLTAANPNDKSATADTRQKALDLLMKGQQDLNAVAQTLSFVRTAGDRLVGVVRATAAKVDSQIDNANTDFSQYRSVVAGLIPQADIVKLQPGNGAQATAAGGAGAKSLLQGFQEEAAKPAPAPTLKTASDAVENSMAAIEPILKTIDVAGIQSSLNACLIK